MFIIFDTKSCVMKNNLLIKVALLSPLLLLLSYLLMAAIGCMSGILGFGDDFYCGLYCLIGKIVLGLACILFFYLIYPDIKAILKIWKSTSSKE